MFHIILKGGQNMYEKLVESYLSNLKSEDLKNLAKNYQLALTDQEAKAIETLLKRDYKRLLKGDYQETFDELKKQVSKQTYDFATKLYFDAQKKYHF